MTSRRWSKPTARSSSTSSRCFKGGSPLVVSRNDDATEVGQAMANSCRAVSGVLVDAHIGDRLSEELFSRVASRAASQANELLEQLQFFHIVASLSFA
ncbi:hypothetical protein Acr_03g0011260 [Actinidia rufa]|uniref:Uncharacterized protein n=1 Tax=Actinidia rufa TaxID=165716 RepID=A0A7J0EDC7_9ERIC|nr:hypothetical protein Acr_03g0011260 [Actinidia rufa]